MVQLTIFVGICVGYISTYVFRVANKVCTWRRGPVSELVTVMDNARLKCVYARTAVHWTVARLTCHRAGVPSASVRRANLLGPADHLHSFLPAHPLELLDVTAVTATAAGTWIPEIWLLIYPATTCVLVRRR